MYTAIILICLAGDIKGIGSCYVAMSQILYETREECEYAVYNAVRTGSLKEDAGTGKVLEPADYQCINWNGMRL